MKRIKMEQFRAIHVFTTVAAVVVLGGAPTALQAQDGEAGGCSNATFSGLYGLAVEGVILQPDAPAPVQFNVAGLMQADGMGTLTVFRQMTNAGGVVFPLDWAAVAQPAVEYSVNADCTATIEFFVPGDSGVPIVPPDGLPFGASLVFVNGGREAFGIQTSPPNAVLNVRLKRTTALDEQLGSDVSAVAAAVAAVQDLLARAAARLGLVP